MKKILLGNELLIIFAVIGDTTFGVDIRNVVSIIEPKKIRTVPLVPKYINSILSYHGKIVTLFDMKTYFKYESSSPSEDKKIIYLKPKELHIGLPVDKINGIDYVLPSCIESIPKDQNADVKAGFCQGLFLLDEDSPGIFWLDPNKIEEFVSQIEMPL